VTRISDLASDLGVSFDEVKVAVNELAVQYGAAWAVVHEDQPRHQELPSGIYQDQTLTEDAVLAVTQKLGGVG
jgi:hypothetical protein